MAKRGSVLGSVLFIVYVNDMISRVLNVNDPIDPVGYSENISLIQCDQNRKAL